MTHIDLSGLPARNPLAYFAALGALDVATRRGSRDARLSWSEELSPRPQLHTRFSLAEFIEEVLEDRNGWQESVAMNGPEKPADDLKPNVDETWRWFEVASGRSRPEDLALLHALLSDGARAEVDKDKAKPTSFHFTAGQQKFLQIMRGISDGLTAAHLEEALIGPWKGTAEFKTPGWDNRDERIHALSGFAPTNLSKNQKEGVPGADWLAFLGLRFCPVATAALGKLTTTGCTGKWKRESFAWPIWDGSLSSFAVQSALQLTFGRNSKTADPSKRHLTDRDLFAQGLRTIYSAPIRRTDSGGYGSFGPAQKELLLG